MVNDDDFSFSQKSLEIPKNKRWFSVKKRFWETAVSIGIVRDNGGFAGMRKKNFKGRCEKRKIPKCSDVCRTYDPIQYAYADVLATDKDVREIRCNVLLDGLEVGEYTTDFLCVKADGDLMVRECVFRKHLTKPMTIKLLDASKEYWQRHGVTDWGLVIDAEV